MNVQYLLMIVIIDSLLVNLFNKSFGKLLPTTFMLASFLMYIGGLLNNFNIAFGLIVVLCIISITIFIVKYKNNSLNNFNKSFFNLSLIATIIVFVGITILHYGRRFMFIDEFCHLGLMAKESYRLNRFHLVKESLMWYNKEYPPFYTLLEVLFCKIGGSFKESYCYMAMSFFNLSLLIGILDNLKIERKNVFKFIITIVLILLIGTTISFTDSLAYNTLFYNSIYLDLPIGLLLGYIFFTIYNFDNSQADYFILTISLCSLVLTKQISIAFYLLVVVTFILVNIIVNKNKDYFKYFFVVSLPLVINFSWSNLVNKNEIESKFDAGSFDFLLIFKYLRRLTNDYETDIVNKFLERITTANTIVKPFNMSYVTIVLVIFITLSIIGYIAKNNKITIVAIMFFLGSIGYAYAMMLSYVYSFGPYEGPYLTMFDRYMETYIFFGYVLLFLVSYSLIKNDKYYLVMLVILLSFTSLNSIKSAKPVLKSEGMIDEYNQRYIDFVNNLNEERVLVISQNDPLLRNVLRYYTIDRDMYTTYLDVEYADGADWGSGTVMWEEDFAEYLKDYDYIYLCDFDDSFFHYKSYFLPEVAIAHIYKIDWKEVYDVNCFDITVVN